MKRFPLLFAAMLLSASFAVAQGLTGALVGTVSDDQGGVLAGAVVHVRSDALIGGTATAITNEKGQLRFPTLPPGSYVLDIELPGFAAWHEEDIPIGPGATIERSVTLKVAGVAESIVVQTSGSRIEVRNPGFGTHFGAEDLKTIPTRRASMFDFIRMAPGISPTSPSGGTTPASGTTTTVSAFGSGTNENQFLIDGTNFTCPCNGVARAEAGVDFIQEVQIHSVGASPEFGNVQGAVINIILRQGSNRLLADAAYYSQADALTGQPVRLPITASTEESGYTRVAYRDFTTSLGGPVRRDRLWFFGGYQSLRDEDSQPGTLAAYPRKAGSEKFFGKLTWQLAPGWQLVQSFHDELQDNWDQSTIVNPFETTVHRTASVPATTFGHLTHTSASTVWDLLAGRFVYSVENTPSTGSLTAPYRIDNLTNIASGGPMNFGSLTIQRTTAKATMSHYRTGLFGGDHEMKTGLQIEEASHHSIMVIPGGVRYTDRSGSPVQSFAGGPSSTGGQFITASAFVTDGFTVGNRLTINAGVRFDHNRAISQALPGADAQAHETEVIVQGLGTMYTWNLWSPRVGVAAKITGDGRTMLRASYGRFSQGVMTGELEPFHPGGTTTTTANFNPATGQYSSIVQVVSPLDLRINPDMQAPHTDDYSIGIDREIGRQFSVAIAYVRKDGSDFIGWTDIGGQYAEVPATFADGRPVILPDGQTVSVLRVSNRNDRRYLLTNPDGYALTYNGLVAVVEKRRAQGWQALASYTYSRAYGLMASSGATAAGAQVNTVSPPQPITFGRDPNDLTNAVGRLPNDRPHVFRAMGSTDLRRTGFVVAADLQYYSGKPWAATALINPQNPTQRVLLEPRGTRRLSSQTLLDLRISRSLPIGTVGRVDLILDVLNALNDSAEESIIGDDLFNTATFGQPSTFIDPRRAMLGVRMNLGR